jgi:hypothetical protein
MRFSLTALAHRSAPGITDTGSGVLHKIKNLNTGSVYFEYRYVPLESSIRRMKTVPLDCDTMLTARDLGISFGD